MKTRQIRFSTLEQFRKRLKEFTGKKINIVMDDRTVLFGELRSLDDTVLVFVNMREAAVTLPVKDINEIYLDVIE